MKLWEKLLLITVILISLALLIISVSYGRLNTENIKLKQQIEAKR